MTTSSIFLDKKFTFNSHCTFTVDETKLADLIINNGGEITKNATKETSYLISSIDNQSFRVQVAKKNNIPIVKENFIVDSVKEGKILDIKDYLIAQYNEDSQANGSLQKLKSSDKNKSLLLLEWSGKTIELTTSITLGRGEEFDVEDTACSRTQVEINVNEEETTIIRRGTNPSILFQSNRSNNPIEMDKDVKYELQDGDSFALLPSKYKCTLQSLPSKRKAKSDDDIQNVTKKVKNINVKLQTTKEEEEEDDDNRPICQYGLNCYRKNEEHRKKHKHIDISSSTSSSLSSKPSTITTTTTTSSSSTSKPSNDDDDDDDNYKYSIAIPPISTSTFEYDVNEASYVSINCIKNFLSKYDDKRIRIYLVDISESPALKALRSCNNINDDRLQIQVADITKLNSFGIPCGFIVNATNAEFFPKGSGVNKAINEAAGPILHKLTKSKYGQAKVGVAYPIRISEDENSQLYKNEKVEYVIHVLGPNMNISRPNCLHGDYQSGNSYLSDCYNNLLIEFAKLSGIEKSSNKNNTTSIDDRSRKEHGTQQQQQQSAFSVMMSSAAKQSKQSPKKEVNNKETKGGGGGFWKDALLVYAKNPEKFPNEVCYYDDDLVVIYDGYPKSTVHLLIMPRKIISGFSKLTKDDVPLLRTMLRRSVHAINQMKEKHKGKELHFKVGFHAVPSMSQLHMHVISDDFDSECLKNKKHWNSFNTEFFISASDFISTLEKNGTISFDKHKYEELLKGKLLCHKCRKEVPTIPSLKSHIKECSNK